MIPEMSVCKQCGDPVRKKRSPFCSRKCFGVSHRASLSKDALTQCINSGSSSLHELSRQLGFDRKTIKKKLLELGICIKHKAPTRTLICSDCSVLFDRKADSRNTKCKVCAKAFTAEKKRLRMRRWALNNPTEAKRRKKEFYKRHKNEIIKLQKQYREAKPELYKETAKRRAELIRDQITEYRRDYYIKNADVLRKKSAQWARENPDKVKANSKNSRIRRRYRMATGRWSAADVAALLDFQNGKCANPYCLVELVKYHVDHIVALARGGSNLPSNIQLLCKECNLRKSIKTMPEFLQREERRVSRLSR